MSFHQIHRSADGELVTEMAVCINIAGRAVQAGLGCAGQPSNCRI